MTAREEAACWLRQLLASGPVAAKDVRRLAAERGHSWRTMQRAKRAVGADAQRVSRRGPIGDEPDPMLQSSATATS